MTHSESAVQVLPGAVLTSAEPLQAPAASEDGLKSHVSLPTTSAPPPALLQQQQQQSKLRQSTTETTQVRSQLYSVLLDIHIPIGTAYPLDPTCICIYI